MRKEKTNNESKAEHNLINDHWEMVTAFTNLKSKNTEGILEFEQILFTVSVQLIKLTFSNLTPFQKLLIILLMFKENCANDVFPISHFISNDISE